MNAVRLEQQYNRELEEMTDEFQTSASARPFSFEQLPQVLASTTRDAVNAADRFVRRNPWAALGIGAAAGCLLGFLLKRK